VRTAAVALSVAGAGISVYLTVLHYAGSAPACVTTGPINCEVVLTSPYSMILGTGVPTSVAGIVWCGVAAVVWAAGRRTPLYVWMAAGMVVVLGLVFIEIGLIGVICLWCTAVHVIVLALFVTAVTVWSAERAS
jgi:uncharacterized membrane protein